MTPGGRATAILLIVLPAWVPSLTAASAQVRAPSCGNRKYCTQMIDCAEAYYQFAVCGDTARDGDGDGIPCENVCGKTLEIMHERLRAQGHDGSGDGQGLLQVPSAVEFSCTPRKTCGQMVSCEEAEFQLRECGNRRLDGNHDGIPCNACAGSVSNFVENAIRPAVAGRTAVRSNAFSGLFDLLTRCDLRNGGCCRLLRLSGR